MGTVWESIERYDEELDEFVSADGTSVRKGDRIRFERGGEVGEITVTGVTSRDPVEGGGGALHADLADGTTLTLAPHE